MRVVAQELHGTAGALDRGLEALVTLSLSCTSTGVTARERGDGR